MSRAALTELRTSHDWFQPGILMRGTRKALWSVWDFTSGIVVDGNQGGKGWHEERSR